MLISNYLFDCYCKLTVIPALLYTKPAIGAASVNIFGFTMCY